VVKRRLVTGVVVVFIIFSNEFLFNTITTAWQPQPIDLSGKQFDAGIVLGGMSMFSKDTTGYFANSSDRFIQANELYQQRVIKKIIVSGGRIYLDQPKEALFIRKQLVLSGVPEVDIIVEDASKNTFENASFTKAKLEEMGLHGPFVLVTSALHMKRAVRVFQKEGLPVIPYPCDYKAVDKNMSASDYIVPDLEVLVNWKFLLKEWAGLFIYSMAGKA
jgi:uncharacterized SAM-binding protein YcdF (DUF218 family)